MAHTWEDDTAAFMMSLSLKFPDCQYDWLRSRSTSDREWEEVYERVRGLLTTPKAVRRLVSVSNKYCNIRPYVRYFSISMCFRLILDLLPIALKCWFSRSRSTVVDETKKTLNFTKNAVAVSPLYHKSIKNV